MISNYQSLLNEQVYVSSCTGFVAEQKRPYHIFTERHMQAMWLEQKYFKSLKNQKKEPIEVISPGIWNSEAGPDFLKAHIRIGNKILRGDIELHLSHEGWYQHGHHNDSNYDNVILHVCFWPPAKEKAIQTSKGRIIEFTSLQLSLTIPEIRILKLLDLDLYPYKQFAGSGSCSRTLFNQLSAEKAKALLSSAAIWRLKEKLEHLKAKVESSNDYFLGGIAMALGYKHNAEAFLTIFNELKKLKIKDEKAMFCHALDQCQFFNDHFHKKWLNSSYYQQLLLLSKSPPFQSPQFKIALKLDKIRPANHPVRRLAILVKMMNDSKIAGLEAKMISLWNAQWNLYKKHGWNTFKNALLELLPDYKDSYWNANYTFEETNSLKVIALFGKDLKREILTNVSLPILYKNVEISGNVLEKTAFMDFYGSLPASKTKKSTYLNYRFFGNNKKIKISKADLQQGAYQIHRDFCIHFEASCHGCPFVERYKKAFLETFKK
jgi:hypothetical protein